MSKAEKKEKKTAVPRSILVDEVSSAGGRGKVKPGKEPVKAVLQAKATANFLRISPRKVKLVIDEIRGRGGTEALARLRLINKKGSRLEGKQVNAAISNAEHNFKLKKEDLYIKEIRADQGSALKRFRPAAFGSAHPIRKPTAHLSVILAVRQAIKKANKHRPKADQPLKPWAYQPLAVAEESKKTIKQENKETKKQ